MAYTVLWLENALWGLRPFGYHLVNILLHAANTVLLWLLLRRLQAPGAWLAAAIFGLHPVHVQSVAWIIEIKDVLSALFYLLAFHAFLRFQARPRLLTCAALAAVFGCAMLSKSVAVSLPLALGLCLW
ncbi:MAG: glycosyltransferase family 39 protein [Candidatus Sumerlaeota bacterium]|nr:glycosyltransferase family 39 protein [Candidatus Sumerlaeota bacterium]